MMDSLSTIKNLQNGQLIGTKELRLQGLGLQTFPPEILHLKDTLELLDLSGNNLTHLPIELESFSKLKIAFFSANQFQIFPEVLGQLPNLEMIGFKSNWLLEVPEAALPERLRWLILTDNRLKQLPDSIGTKLRLQKLMLAGNQLQSLPESMQANTELALLRISANQFASLPPWIWSLPKLAWLAYGANPIQNVLNRQHQVKVASWHDFEIEERLGEGASGLIYKAYDRTSKQQVAIKVFKGGVTSDGLPASEMEACLQANQHPNLVSLEATISDHPELKSAIVMPMIPSSYVNLGGPPTFETCTRDVFPPDRRLEMDSILAIATQMAEASRHLHQNGLMHGDLYAHNIVIDHRFHAILGDFGAATPYVENSKKHQQLEVRAWGYLLEDLLNICSISADKSPVAAVLTDLKNQCLSLEVASRPTFEELVGILKNLSADH